MTVNGRFDLDETRKFDALLADHMAAFQAQQLADEHWSGYLQAVGAATATQSRPTEAAEPKSRYLLCIRDLRGRLVKLSHSWETNLGFRLPDLEGVPLLKLVHPADIWLTHDRMEAVRGGRAAGGFSNRYRCRRGGYRQLEWTARLFGDQVFGVAHDVTDLLEPDRA